MLSRRSFFSIATFFSTATLLSNISYPKTLGKPVTAKLIPKRLKKGDTVGLIAPGYAIKNETLEEIKKILITMGFVPFHTNRIVGNFGYFSNTDKERAIDLNEMFVNKEVDAILCARGGYGCTRIMQMIDYDNIKLNPKILIGFSDITALLNGIYKETGLVTFHGPVGSTLENEYTLNQLKHVVTNSKRELKIKNVAISEVQEKESPEYERYTITNGSATGVLVGGSLTLINALIGTPHDIDFTNKIVCIEDVEEAPYRIDRMLTQLIEGPTFRNASGIVFGVSAGCNTSSNPKSFSLKEVIINRIAPLGIPAAYGMSFGHVPENFTFPIGVRAKWNANIMSLQLLENCVS